MNSLLVYIFKLIVLLNCLIIINCRNISVELNPNCNKECSDSKTAINVVHISSNGENDTIHFLWATMSSVPPTLLIVKTELQAKIEIDWKKLIKSKAEEVSDAIHFSREPINSIGLQISRLFFFNDVNKTGSYNDINYPILEVDWNQFVWKSVEKSISSDSNSIKTRFTQESGHEFYNGSIDIDLSVETNDGRDGDLPHLAFTQLSTSLRISVNNVLTQNGYQFNGTTRARLFANILLVNEGKRTKQINDFQKIISIDDEYTPGVFDRVILNLDSNKNIKSDTKSENSFIQWKSIAYTAEERIIANTIDVIHSEVGQDKTISNNSRILLAFFGNRSHSCVNFNLTFGASDDTNYYNVDDNQKILSFAMVLGLDSPPDQKLSFMVQMIILVGFGLPLLVMVISALYLIVRKIRKRNYDDLLLSQDSIQESRVIS